MQYAQTLPLADHEVVLTFDDGPLPKYSNQVLAILAEQCIKATFFIIGRQANANPEGVRKVADAGHTVGTHSQNHPLTFQKMPVEKVKQEVDGGIASTLAALNGDASKLAPFFRVPGLLRADAVEEYLGSRGIQIWSADFPADDWRHVPPSRVYDLAIQRLEAKGKGILLLHDIHQRTVDALPAILNELMAGGYRIVHVVPETPDRPKTITTAAEWRMGPPPARPKIAAADAGEIKAPARQQRIAKHRTGKSKADKQAAAKQAADKPRPSKTGKTGDAKATGTKAAGTKVVGLSLLGITLGDTDARGDAARPRDRADDKRTAQTGKPALRARAKHAATNRPDNNLAGAKTATSDLHATR